MSILRQWKTMEVLGRTLVIGASAALLVLAAPVVGRDEHRL